MSSNPSDLNIAVFSDIHLGHPRNPTVEIIKNLHKALPDNAETANLDILYLAGDIFDRLQSLPNDEVSEIQLWITSLLRLCKKHDVLLRVLAGTPSHDWDQSKMFLTLNEAAKIGADVKYVKDLSIEYIERYGITVLYVPDEWEDKTEKTLHQVHELLRAKGLEQVDFAIMHGQFEYQLPPHVPAPKHSSKDYLRIVKHLIFIGHVHVHSRYERIIAQGSFDRLSHGEEGPKGHVRAVIKPNGEHNVTFVENEGAMRFVTLDCVGFGIEEILSKTDEAVKSLPDGSHVRLRLDANNPVQSNKEVLIRRYPLMNWTTVVDEQEKELTEIVEDGSTYTPITLTKDNLEGKLVERLISSGSSIEVVDAARDILREVM